MPGSEWYITMAEGTIDDSLTLILQSTPLAESDYLPADGHFWASMDHLTEGQSGPTTFLTCAPVSSSMISRPRREGQSFRSIGRMFGVSRTTVQRRLQEQEAVNLEDSRAA